MKFKYPSIILAIFAILLFSSRNIGQGTDLLRIVSTKEIGQIEVGGPYIGIEIHNSFPLLNRISLYYPVANSIDISEDYWKRENYRIMSFGLKVGNTPKKLLEKEIYEVDQTPYSVSFNKDNYESGINIKYEFCKNKPAMIITYKISNKSNSEKAYEVYTRMETVLRTSHTYKLIDRAASSCNKNYNSISFDYNNIEAGNTRISIINAGLQPGSFTTKSLTTSESKSLDNWWLDNESQLTNELISENEQVRPAAAFIYNKLLRPNESLEIVQIVETSKISEGDEQTEYLLKNYKNETAEYENYVLTEAISKRGIITGDKVLDFSSEWAKAILAVNKHYIAGNTVPMPAQAEYNFYFTHDVLVTDLAAVNFDLNRVKNDLSFIISLANDDKVIPHAYYWKDTEYRTEFANHDNWNNFWINIVTASYLRNSNDISFVEKLYPYLTKSIETALLTMGEDTLMWSFRPDWWDIGKLYGSKTYMTALAARTIEDYIFISVKLGRNIEALADYEKLADKLKENMIQKLWSAKQNYLMNYYEPGKLDPHYYIGSLVPAYMGMLSKEKTTALLKTAKDKLLDENVGIYNAFPMDYNTLGDYLKFVGNEAGDIYYYFNGGIWPQGNAWYALALIQNGQKDDALKFIKNVMTIDGIMKGPNGQPAMYEVRNGNKNNPNEYGKVDKPQFMWAGAWYLNCIYNLFVININSWNLTFAPYLPVESENVSFKLYAAGNETTVNVYGRGENVKSIFYDSKNYPSLVFPSELKTVMEINITLGEAGVPIVSSTNSILNSAELSKDKLIVKLSAFTKHNNITEIISPWEPESVRLNSLTNNNLMTVENNGSMFKIKIGFKHNSTLEEEVIINFKK